MTNLAEHPELTHEQAAIVAHPPHQDARVLAGPGAGKSFTAVAYLEHWTREQPNLAARMITFTRAATNEFATRLGDRALTGLGIEAPSTIHSLALRLLMRLRAHNLPYPLRIPDTWEVKEAIRPMVRDHLRALGHQATLAQVEQLEREMSAGWQAMAPDVELMADENPALGLAFRGVWEEHRHRFGYTLLAELPYRAGSALEDMGTRDDVGVDLLIVDEYQDLNEADIHLIRVAAAFGVAVLAIGDDDQSIYRWRMAAPEGIRRFCQEFPAAADYPLTISRRCGRQIIEAANQVIQTSPDRAIKPALAYPTTASPGTFSYLRFRSGEAEARGIAAIARARVDAGVDPSEVLILVRSRPGIWRQALGPAFEQAGLVLANSEWVEEVLAEPAIRQAIAIAHVTQNPSDSLAWLSLTRHTTVQVGDAFVNYVIDNSDDGERFGSALLRLWGDGFPGAPPSAVRASESIARTRALVDALNIEGALLDATGWGGWIRDNLGDGLSAEAIRLLEMVGEATDPTDGLSGFLSQLEPVGKDLAAKQTGGVRLMGMARSKGLTVNTTIVAGVEDGLIPMPPPRGHPTEEIRLLYVALTRATDMCVMTFAGTRRGQLARQGRGNPGRRMRSPLLANLQVGQPVDGEAFVRQLGT